MSTLATRGHVATDEDIRNLVRGVLDALTSASGSKLDYLKAIVGTTIHELGAPSRPRAAKGGKIKDDEVRAAHLSALEAVNDRFYDVVKKATAEKLGELGLPRKGEDLNKRTNYARTSFYVIRAWIKAGNDITQLVPAKVSKGSLEVAERPRRRPSASRLTTRAERQSKQLLATFKTLAAADREAAVAELDALLSKLLEQMTELNGKATKDPRRAMSERLPLRAPGGLFMPASRMR